jgi:hypothetical protein
MVELPVRYFDLAGPAAAAAVAVYVHALLLTQSPACLVLLPSGQKVRLCQEGLCALVGPARSCQSYSCQIIWPWPLLLTQSTCLLISCLFANKSDSASRGSPLVGPAPSKPVAFKENGIAFAADLVATCMPCCCLSAVLPTCQALQAGVQCWLGLHPTSPWASNENSMSSYC